MSQNPSDSLTQVRERHKEMVKLEEDIIELNNLFEEFAEQVVNQVFSVQSLHVDHRLMSWFQADTIDNIELNMERAQNEVEEGEIIIEEARELAETFQPSFRRVTISL